jgi:predicted acetylornithine/succinylornithine family transaminase
MPTYGPRAIEIVRGEGSWVWDDQGRKLLDLLSGLAVTSLGHSHPVVADAIAHQARTLLHVSNLFGSEPGPEVARTLDRLLGVGQPGWPAEGTRGQVFFCRSGGEANECALKLARKFGGRGRHVVVSAYGSFHGRTLATLHATGQPAKHEAFQPLPEGFKHATWADLGDLERQLDPSVAAILLEPVQGEGGVNPASAEYFQGVRRLCDERGILMVVDEVQTGLGRCGSWFAHQALGVVPDVVTMAKALGNGVPIGACWAKAEVAAAFEPGDHATTYGGQPLAASAAKAVLAVMEAEDVPARATRAGARITEALSALGGVAYVRGMGLLLGVELDGLDAKTVNQRLLEQGAVANAVTPTALRLAPSLLITDDEIDLAVELIGKALTA